MDDVPWKAIWIVGGVTTGLVIIGIIANWAGPYIEAILPG